MFKPGDVVICVDNTDCDLREGKEYTVRQRDPSGYGIYVYLVERPGIGTGYGKHRFRLKTKEEFVKDFIKETCKCPKL